MIRFISYVQVEEKAAFLYISSVKTVSQKAFTIESGSGGEIT